MSTFPLEPYEQQDQYIRELRAEIEKLKETLQFIDDHGRALAAMEIIKEQQAEIERLKEELAAQKK